MARFAVDGNARFELRADRLGAVTVTGDLSDSKVLVIPRSAAARVGLGSLAVARAMRGVWVNTLADIGSVSAGGMADTVIAAGVAYVETAPGAFEQPLPAESADAGSFAKVVSFTGKYSIRSVTVTPRVGQAYAFENSRIGAYRIGSVKIDDVRSDNGKRPFGVSAYNLGRLLRKFGGADASKTNDTNPVSDFVARQIFRPLVFRPSGNYGGYYGGGGGPGAVSIVDNVTGFEGTTCVVVPAEGVNVGSVLNHPAAAAVFLRPDGSYEARDAAGAVVVPAASLAEVVLAVAGVSGISMKAEVKAPVAQTQSAPSVDGSIIFLATSVGAAVVLPFPASPVVYQVSVPGPLGSNFRGIPAPTQAEVVAAVKTRGVEVQEFSRPLVRLRPGGVEVARSFDDAGLRRFQLLPDQSYVVTDAAGASAAGTDFADLAFRGGAPLGGRQRLPVWVVAGNYKLTFHGLARGGTLVYDAANENVIDPSGGVFTLPGFEPFRQRLTDGRIPFEVNH